jgi:hypothetical protein
MKIYAVAYSAKKPMKVFGFSLKKFGCFESFTELTVIAVETFDQAMKKGENFVKHSFPPSEGYCDHKLLIREIPEAIEKVSTERTWVITNIS